MVACRCAEINRAITFNSEIFFLLDPNGPWGFPNGVSYVRIDITVHTVDAHHPRVHLQMVSITAACTIPPVQSYMDGLGLRRSGSDRPLDETRNFRAWISPDIRHHH